MTDNVAWREPVVLCPICSEVLVNRWCLYHGFVPAGFAGYEKVEPVWATQDTPMVAAGGGLMDRPKAEPQYSEVGVLKQRLAITAARHSLVGAFDAMPEGTLKTTAYKAAQQALERAEDDLILMLAHIESRKK